jgi:hypothetical protein
MKVQFVNVSGHYLRLQDAVYNVYITGGGGGGLKNLSRGDYEKQGEKLLRLLPQLRQKIRPQHPEDGIFKFLRTPGIDSSGP